MRTAEVHRRSVFAAILSLVISRPPPLSFGQPNDLWLE